MRKSLPVFPQMTTSDMKLAMECLREYGGDNKDLELFVQYLYVKMEKIDKVIAEMEKLDRAVTKDATTNVLNRFIASFGKSLRQCVNS